MANGLDKKKNLKKFYQARWKNKTWTITKEQARVLSDASMTAEYEKSGKKKTFKTEARLSFPLYKQLVPNMDIAAEIWSWRKLVKKKGVLYVGGVALGGCKQYQLVGVDVSNIAVVRGDIVQCDIELHFNGVKKSFSRKKYKRTRKKVYKKSKKLKKKWKKR